MLQIVKKERPVRNSQPRENYQLIELCDQSLQPVALAGDFVLIAEYAAPQNGDMVALELEGDRLVRYWRQSAHDVSMIVLSDGQGSSQIVPLSQILVLGVAREIRRPIVRELYT